MVVAAWLGAAVVLLLLGVLVGPGWLRLALSTGALAVLVKLNIQLDPSITPGRSRAPRGSSRESA